MKRRGRRDDVYRNNRRKMLRIKHRRWKKNGGRCEECLQQFGENELEIHHVIPVSEHPELVASADNIRLLCHQCHLRQHRSTGSL